MSLLDTAGHRVPGTGTARHHIPASPAAVGIDIAAPAHPTALLRDHGNGCPRQRDANGTSKPQVVAFPSFSQPAQHREWLVVILLWGISHGQHFPLPQSPQHWQWARWGAVPGLLRLVLQSHTTVVLGIGIGTKQRAKLFYTNTKMEFVLKDNKLKKTLHLQSC